MGELLWSYVGRFADFSCDFCDSFAGAGHTDYLEALVVFAIIVFPLSAVVAEICYQWLKNWFSVKGHREDVAAILLVILSIPAIVVFTIVVIAENQKPLITGIQEYLRKYYKTGIRFIKDHI